MDCRLSELMIMYASPAEGELMSSGLAVISVHVCYSMKD